LQVRTDANRDKQSLTNLVLFSLAVTGKIAGSDLKSLEQLFIMDTS